VTTDTIPGYYNHCAVCGHVAAAHYKQAPEGGSGYTEPEHEFVPRPDERLMASHAPMWRDFWALEDRVAALEAQIAKNSGGVA
jgi:hypothetical protein